MNERLEKIKENWNDLSIVHYCHPNCAPFMNICRLPKEEAFQQAYKMAADNHGEEAFWRFKDFENYYPRRIRADEYLYSSFIALGGKPKEKHPLFFVLQGSKFLNNWFGNGSVTKIPLKNIPSEAISFTLGDSSVMMRDYGEATMHTKETLQSVLGEYSGSVDDFMGEVVDKYKYIEAQLWDDEYCVS